MENSNIFEGSRGFVEDINNVPCAVARVKITGRNISILRANDEFYKLMDCTRQNYKAKYGNDLPLIESPCELFRRLVDDGETVLETEFCQHSGKAERWILVKAEVVARYADKCELYVSMTDISSYKKAQQMIDEENKRLEDMANSDSLTGFYNKVVAESTLEEYFHGEGKNVPGALLVVDIDNFKQVNDTWGHLFGDKVLTSVADKLRQVFRRDDIIGRIGGDEFVVFVKNVNKIKAIEERTENLCAAVREICCDNNAAVQISCSIGIALYPLHGENYRSLFHNADMALYTMKSAGKNSFSLFTADTGGLMPEPLTKPRRGSRPQTKANRQQNINLMHIFKLLFQTDNMSSAVNSVLSLLGSYFQLDRVYIFERVNENDARIRYEWCREDVVSCSYQKQFFDKLFHSRRLFKCNDVDRMSDKKLAELFKHDGVKASLKSAMYIQNMLAGAICFDDCTGKRVWSFDEIEMINLVAEIMGTYMSRMRVQKSIVNMAYVDQLTGMWNLNKFRLKTEEILFGGKPRKRRKYAMVCFDIKKFRHINENYGYEVGDRVLRYVALMLAKLTVPQMGFTRVVADKFLVLVMYRRLDSFTAKLRSVMDTLQYYSSGQTGLYKLVFNCGVYLIDFDTDKSVNTIIDRADMARMTVSGNCGESRYVVYDQQLHERLQREKELDEFMETALLKNQFLIYYQPKVDVRSNKVKGAEALVRWRHPRDGVVTPDKFIPLLEKNGFIAKMDFCVFELVYKDIRRWLDNDLPVVPISINLSRVHIGDNTFIDRFMELTHRYAIPVELVEIELTENIFTNDGDRVIAFMNRLHNEGFAISIDDFGSGYSSLNLLRKLRADYLKLDKNFLDANSDEREKIVLCHVISMAKELGLEIVCEGVEREEQARCLQEWGCYLVQGYLYSKPLPVVEFEQFIGQLAL